MRNRPVILVLTALAILVAVASIPLQVMVMYGHGLSEFSAVLTKLTLLNYIVMGLGVTGAVLVLNGSPGTRIVLPLLIMAVAINNYFVGSYATDFSIVTATLGSVGFAALNMPLLLPHIRLILAHPEKRWWRRAERKRVSTSVFIGGSTRGSVRAQTYDLSMTGMFIPLKSTTTDLKLDETVSICLRVGVLSQMRCQGRVVRIADAKGTYPCGVGVEFTGLPRQQKRDLKRFMGNYARGKETPMEVP